MAAEVKEQKKYMKKSEIVTFGIGLFGVALLTGWMPDYTTTFFADFAFKGKGFDSAQIAHIVEVVFLIAGFVGAICELVIGILVDRTKTSLGKVKPWIGFGAIPLALIVLPVPLPASSYEYVIPAVLIDTSSPLTIAVCVASENLRLRVLADAPATEVVLSYVLVTEPSITAVNSAGLIVSLAEPFLIL